MSCGRLHEPGHGFDLPAPGGTGDPGGGEGYEYVRVGGPGSGPQDPAGSGGGPYGLTWEEPGAAAPTVREPGPVRIAVAGAGARHGYAIKPFCWVAGVDGAAILVHQMAASRVLGFGPLAAVVTAFLGGLAAEVGTEVRNNRRKRSFAWKTLIRLEIFIATPWAARRGRVDAVRLGGHRPVDRAARRPGDGLVVRPRGPQGPQARHGPAAGGAGVGAAGDRRATPGRPAAAAVHRPVLPARRAALRGARGPVPGPGLRVHVRDLLPARRAGTPRPTSRAPGC